MKYEQFLEFYNTGPESVYKLMLSIIETNKVLMDKVSSLSQQVALQDERIKELESQLNKNSRNTASLLPPMSLSSLRASVKKVANHLADRKGIKAII